MFFSHAVSHHGISDRVSEPRLLGCGGQFPTQESFLEIFIICNGWGFLGHESEIVRWIGKGDLFLRLGVDTQVPR